jgi:hypothetical protein
MKAHNLKKAMESIHLKMLIKLAVLRSWMAFKNFEAFDQINFSAWILHGKMFWVISIVFGSNGWRVNKMGV